MNASLRPWLAISAILHAVPLGLSLVATSHFASPRAGVPHAVQFTGQVAGPASRAAPAARDPLPGSEGTASAPGDSAPAADAYLADARARIEARLPARLPQSVRDAVSRAGHALQAELLVRTAGDGAADGVELSRSTGAPEVDALLLRLARQVERFLPPADGKPFQFLVPLELYAGKQE